MARKTAKEKGKSYRYGIVSCNTVTWKQPQHCAETPVLCKASLSMTSSVPEVVVMVVVVMVVVMVVAVAVVMVVAVAVAVAVVMVGGGGEHECSVASLEFLNLLEVTMDHGAYTFCTVLRSNHCVCMEVGIREGGGRD